MNAAFLTLWGWPTSYSHWTQLHDCCGSFCPLRPKIGIPAIARQYIRVRGDAPNGLWVCWRPDGSVYCVSGIPKQLPLKNRLQHSGPRPTPSQPCPRAAERPAWPAEHAQEIQKRNQRPRELQETPNDYKTCFSRDLQEVPHLTLIAFRRGMGLFHHASADTCACSHL